MKYAVRKRRELEGRVCNLHGIRRVAAEQELGQFTEEQMRLEVAIFTKGITPEGWNKLEPMVYSRRLTDKLFVTLVWCPTWAPGWSWYVNDTPGIQYKARGGVCLFGQVDLEEIWKEACFHIGKEDETL